MGSSQESLSIVLAPARLLARLAETLEDKTPDESQQQATDGQGSEPCPEDIASHGHHRLQGLVTSLLNHGVPSGFADRTERREQVSGENVGIMPGDGV